MLGVLASQYPTFRHWDTLPMPCKGCALCASLDAVCVAGSNAAEPHFATRINIAMVHVGWLQVVKKNSKLLVMCAVGGTLDTNVSYRRDKKLFAGEGRPLYPSVGRTLYTPAGVPWVVVPSSAELSGCETQQLWQGVRWWIEQEQLQPVGLNIMCLTSHHLRHLHKWASSANVEHAREQDLCCICPACLSACAFVCACVPAPPPSIADPERAFGRESRSLKAIYELYEEAGWNLNNIRHVEGGFQQWRYQVGVWGGRRGGRATS